MISRLLHTAEWRLFGVLWASNRRLSTLWWLLIVLRGFLPGAFAIAMGQTVQAVDASAPLGPALAFIALLFLAMQAINPVQEVVSTLLGASTTSWLSDRLLRASIEPDGLAHLENPALNERLSSAREFDQGTTGPDITTAMPMVASGFSMFLGGVIQTLILAGFRWWAPLVVGGAWLSTHVYLKKGAVWHGRQDDDVRELQRRADYAYKLAVRSPAAKEIRLFGLAEWIVGGFRSTRNELLERSWEDRRLGWRSVRWALLFVSAANIALFWALADAARRGDLSSGALVVFAQAAIGARGLAFGAWDWWFRTAAQPIPAVLDLAADMQTVGGHPTTAAQAGALADGAPTTSIEFHDVSFAYPNTDAMVLDGLSLEIRAGESLAIVGQNGAGKTTLAKLLCRLYDPTSGEITIDGRPLTDIGVRAWRNRLAAVFQDFVRYEWSLTDNVAPAGGDQTVIDDAITAAAAGDLAAPDTILSKAYAGGTDLSGGQWQRVAIARALAAVGGGAGVLLLDEPTAHLDVRAETVIFERVLDSARGATIVLISHRFATVRRADRIAVVEGGRVIEQGSHDELMRLGGRYHRMFSLQAARFDDPADGDAPSDESIDVTASADVLAGLGHDPGVAP